NADHSGADSSAPWTGGTPVLRFLFWRRLLLLLIFQPVLDQLIQVLRLALHVFVLRPAATGFLRRQARVFVAFRAVRLVHHRVVGRLGVHVLAEDLVLLVELLGGDKARALAH